MLEIERTDEFAKWLKKLKDANDKARINLRVHRIELTGNLGDHKPSARARRRSAATTAPVARPASAGAATR